MATLVPDRPRIRRGIGALRATPDRGAAAPRLLGLALLAVTTYAVFAHGAIDSPAEPRVQVALELVAALTAAIGLSTGSLRLRAPRAALVAAGLLTAFAVWTAVTLAWSVAPDSTWLEFNRVVAYAIVLVLAMVLGHSLEDALEKVAAGLLGLVALVALYGLGQKLVPGLDILGLVDLNQTGSFARLQEPIGYWNALALLLAMGAPMALAFAGRRQAPKSLRLASLVALQLILLAGAFTISRGGTLALLVALGSFLLLSGSLLRLSMWLGAAVVSVLPPMLLGLTSHALSADHVALAKRESAGLLLLVVLVGCAVVLALAGERLLTLEPRIDPSPALLRRLRIAILAATAVIVIGGLAAVVLSGGGLTGGAHHGPPGTVTSQVRSISNPDRLFSTDSTYRIEWFKEALGAFSARPLTGWGGGSFAVVHLLFRHDGVPVTHTHSVPLQWLAETGLVGALLALAAWAGLLFAGFVAVLRRTATTRSAAAAVMAAALAYALHALYDWDWDIPAVTLPALIALGVLAGSCEPPRRARSELRAGPALRLLGVVAMTLSLCVLALSSVLPSVAAGRAASALVTAAGPQAGGLARAADEAARAGALDPLSDAGPLAQAAIALQRHDLALAQVRLLQAVHRVPTDERAWAQLATTDLYLRQDPAALAAAQRLFALDPFSPTYAREAVTLAEQAQLVTAPPRASATAGPTP